MIYKFMETDDGSIILGKKDVAEKQQEA